MNSWDKQSIQELLDKNDKALAKALILLNERQTQDEQQQETTKHLNNRGFKPCHARMGTNMAQFYLRNNYLSIKQLAYWRVRDKNGSSRIGCYWRQLLEEIEKKEQVA